MPLYEKLNLIQPVYNLILTMPDGIMSDIINEAYALANRCPEILTKIENDQVNYGKEKKAKRIQDKQWLKSQNSWFSWFLPKSIGVEASELTLGFGRKRMPPLLVLIYMLIRGTFGGIKSRETQVMLQESISLHILFQNLGINSPGQSTITENINAVSNTTRDEILTLHLQTVLANDLDDFKVLIGDSTSVKGNSAYPTDSSILVRLVERIFHIGQTVERYGITPMSDMGFSQQIKQIKSVAKSIAFAAGKKGSKRKTKRLYGQLLKKIKKIHNTYAKEVKKIQKATKKLSILPSRKQRLEELVKVMVDDHENLVKVSDYCRDWFFEEKKTNSNEKVLSLADKDAAFIQKGGRSAVIGYKPQLGRSENGFISSIIVPDGNAADSTQLEPLINDAIERLGVIPQVASFDDGYTNTEVRDTLLANGIEIVSISGAKGKRMIPEDVYNSDEYQKARNDRSAVESLMYTVKHNHKFGQVMRRGIEDVRAELLEKALAYNLARAIFIRERKLAKAA